MNIDSRKVPDTEKESCEKICKVVSYDETEDTNGNFILDHCEDIFVDDDKDGIPNTQDNCKDKANSNQHDADNDGKHVLNTHL